jgi:sensor histidine kinase YesM
VPEHIADMPIPTLLVQPLVENAVKHGIAASRTGGHIAIRATLQATGQLHISVRNTGAPLRGRSPGAVGGVGLRHVEQRLTSYYGNATRFSLATAETGETADLWLPAGRELHRGSASGARRARG